jgi:hypothetical protein
VSTPTNLSDNNRVLLEQYCGVCSKMSRVPVSKESDRIG